MRVPRHAFNVSSLAFWSQPASVRASTFADSGIGPVSLPEPSDFGMVRSEPGLLGPDPP